MIKFWVPPVRDEGGDIRVLGEWRRLALVETEAEAETTVREMGKTGVVVVAKSEEGEISFYPSGRSFAKLKWIKS